MPDSALDTPVSAPLDWPVALPPQTALQESIHEHHHARRDRIILALFDTFMPWSQKVATRMAYCCNGASFFIDPSVGKVKPWLSRCHVRLCPYCGNFRAGLVAQQLIAILHQMKHPRVIVLTVKAVDTDLREQLRELRHNFAKLRRTKMWKHLVDGGAYTLHITRNPKSGLWHPHLHILADGLYFPVKLLRKLWHEATGSAEIVWIEKIRDYQGAVRDLTRYVGSPPHVDELPPAAIRDYASAVSGARMVQTFGNCHGLKLVDKDPPDTESPDTYQVKISRLVHLTKRGAQTPAKLLVLIAERWPQFRAYIYHQIPRLERHVTRTDRIARLFKLADARSPPPKSPPAAKLAKEIQTREIFTAFCRFRADDRANVFTDLEYQGPQPLPWT